MKAIKGISSLLAILFGIWIFFQLLRVVWFLAWILLPFIVAAGVLYALGYFAPPEMRAAVEKNIRAFLDWLDLNTPHWAWPFIKLVRKGLDWLGLHVPK